uniref:C2H2-type domain-containing protein n=1 Tax=Naja naja TaxID=35670 RepID=A0A8C6XJQ9_NAJNA
MKHPRTDMGSRKRPECLACGKSFRDVSQVLRHQTVHTGERPYSCLECGQSFTQKPALNRHKRKHLKGETYKGDQERHGNQENSHWVEATSSWAWPNQTIPENRVGPFAGSLGQWPSMNQPPKAASGTDREGKTARKTISRRGQKRYWCFVCIKGFRDKADLVRHDRIHTGEKPYTCPDCGRKFSYTSSLYKHQLIHRRAASLKGNQFREVTIDYNPDGFSATRAAPLACLEGSGERRNGVNLVATEVKPPTEALLVGKADTQSNQFRETTIDYDPDGFSATCAAPLACLEGGGGWRNGVKLEATEEKPPMEALSVGKADTQSSDFAFSISAT